MTDIHSNNEFDIESLKNELQPISMHFYAKNEHVGIIENGIKTIKYRVRCMCHETPYKRFEKFMACSLAEGEVEMLKKSI